MYSEERRRQKAAVAERLKDKSSRAQRQLLRRQEHERACQATAQAADVSAMQAAISAQVELQALSIALAESNGVLTGSFHVLGRAQLDALV